MITIDFETRSRADLLEAGAYYYAAHESTEILCLAWECEGQVYAWSPFKDYGASIHLLEKQIEKHGILEAHNSEFEWAVWNYCGVKKYGFKKLPQEIFSCSAAKSAALSLPRDLFTVGKVLGVKDQKDMEGYTLMMKMCKPDKKGEWVFDLQKLDRLVQYCKSDVISETQVSAKMSEMIQCEKEIFKANMRMNRRGIPIDSYTVKIAQNYLEKYSVALRAQLKTLTGGKVETESQIARIMSFCNEKEWGHKLVGLDVEEVKKALASNPPPLVKRVLEIRQVLGLASVKKIKRMRDIVMLDGRVRGAMLYAGASRTGRWSSKGIQFQNLAKGSGKFDIEKAITLIERCNYEEFSKEFSNVAMALSECIRAFIKAPHGKIFYAGDYASIEVRVLFWLAGQTDALAILAKDGDIYKEMAASVYSKPVSAIQKNERNLGKALVLACGYGLGASKFIESCLKPPYEMVLDEDFAKKAVYGYRARFSKVPQFWKDCEKAFKDAIRNEGVVFLAGKIKFLNQGGNIKVKLPSGRCLNYFNAKISVVDFKTKKEAHEIEDETGIRMAEQISYWGMSSVTNKWDRIFTHGGVIVENITQATARDIMAQAMIKLESKGFNPIFTVHDEIVCEELEDKNALKEFTSIMESIPVWLSGCPIKVESESFRRYKK